MDIKKLNEQMEEFLNHKFTHKPLQEEIDNSKEYEKLKQLLLEEKEVQIEGTTIYTEGTWDHVDPATYSQDDIDAKFEGYAIVEENDDNTWQYNISVSILEKTYVGKDEDGYPDFDYIDTDYNINEEKSFNTKEEAVNGCIEYIKDLGDLYLVEEA